MFLESYDAAQARVKVAKALLGKDADNAAELLSHAAKDAKSLLGNATEGTAALFSNSAKPIDADESAKVLLSKAAKDAKALLNDAAITAEVLLGEATKTAEALLARVKRLEGIIPICSYCKRIRDDQDCWRQIEEYLSEHSDAMFSHGLCPQCMEMHMPIM